MSDLIPLRQRGLYQAFMNGAFSTGLALGAPLGGLVADTFGWRWSFGIQIPLIMASTFLIWAKIKLPKKTTLETTRQRLRRVDFGGAILLVFHLNLVG
jgi:predicted MFS family arabinose efflux permease